MLQPNRKTATHGEEADKGELEQAGNLRKENRKVVTLLNDLSAEGGSINISPSESTGQTYLLSSPTRTIQGVRSRNHKSTPLSHNFLDLNVY